MRIAKDLARSSNIVDVINTLYKYPIITAKQLEQLSNVPITSINRYLSTLVENKILYTDQKSRNRTYFYCDLLDILR